MGGKSTSPGEAQRKTRCHAPEDGNPGRHEPRGFNGLRTASGGRIMTRGCIFGRFLFMPASASHTYSPFCFSFLSFSFPHPLFVDIFAFAFLSIIQINLRYTMPSTATPPDGQAKVDQYSKDVPWYHKELGDLSPACRELLENYSHIPADEVIPHVLELVRPTHFYPRPDTTAKLTCNTER